MRAIAVAALPLMALVHANAQGEELERCPIRSTITWYDVRGSTPEEVRQSLIERGPKDEFGKRRFAYAEWSIHWNWKLDKNKNVDLSTVTISCEGTLVLPRFIPAADAPPELRSEWDRYLDRLMRHEEQHLAHPERNAFLIIKRLKAAKAKDGDLSLKRAQKIVQNVIYHIREMDRIYDLETNHGKSEGTWAIQD